jgi:hypothetical protein
LTRLGHPRLPVDARTGTSGTERTHAPVLETETNPSAARNEPTGDPEGTHPGNAFPLAFRRCKLKAARTARQLNLDDDHPRDLA